MESKLSSSVTNNISNNIANNFVQSNNHWWIKLINSRLWFGWWMMITFVSANTIICSFTIFRGKFFHTTVTIISISSFLLATFLLTQTLVLRTKIYRNFSNQLPMTKYYDWALTNANNQVQIATIGDNWTIFPQGNLPKDEIPYYYNYCENIMIGTVNQQPFNFGSIINQKIMHEIDKGYDVTGQVITTDKPTYYYTRFLYYTTIITNNNLQMTLVPRHYFSKKMRRKNKVALESSLFEDLFEVKCNDPIKLRMLLAPKIMNTINNFSAQFSTDQLPVIHINNDQLTLSWKYELGKNRYFDNKGKIMALPTTNNYQKMIKQLLVMINDDINKLLLAQLWVNDLALLSS